MKSVTLDELTSLKLRGTESGTALADPAGKVVGHLISYEDYELLLTARALERHTDEEEERLRQQPSTGRKLSEILEALECSSAAKEPSCATK